MASFGLGIILLGLYLERKGIFRLILKPEPVIQVLESQSLTEEYASYKNPYESPSTAQAYEFSLNKKTRY